jgi:LuxR family maltose regulon positive regulatory protein
VRVIADSAAAIERAGPRARAWLVPRPGLFERLGGAERVVLVSAAAGSGKTFLLRSWIAAEGLSDRAAWVSVGRQVRDAQAFWLAVVDSLRRSMQAFPSLSASRSGEDTLLTGSLPDHSALYGVIHQLEALGLQLLEIRCG